MEIIKKEESIDLVKSSNMLKSKANKIGLFDMALGSRELLWVSEEAFEILGILDTTKEITIDNFMNLVLEDNREDLTKKINSLVNDLIVFDVNIQIRRVDNDSIRNLNIKTEIKKDRNNNYISILGILKDITDILELESSLKTSETMFKTLYERSPIGIALIDSFSGKIYEANKSYINLLGIDFENNNNVDWMSFTHPDDLKEDLENMALMNANKLNGFRMDKRYIREDGSIIWVKITIVPIIIDGSKTGRHIAIVDDISQEQKLFEEVKYASEHDILTGLYNRRFFNDEFQRLYNEKAYPISLIIGDINGLKTFNDTYGHVEGDMEIYRIGNKINDFLKGESFCCRVGGDEFAIIMHGHNENEIKELTDNLSKHVNCKSSIKNSLTISFGYGIQRNPKDSLDDLYKEADAFMYGNKNYNAKSTRSNSISIIMNTLFEKNGREKEHSERVGNICEIIAKKLSFTEDMVNRIKVAGYFHDIGKIAIDESILNKEGPLSSFEWEAIKLHTGKGYRILSNSNEYMGISEAVLSHHERFDGKGYPNGLAGKDIPIESRIISLADSYDAMTQKRSYKKIMTKKQAIQEIRKCSSSQFDPEIAEVFIKCIKNNLI